MRSRAALALILLLGAGNAGAVTLGGNFDTGVSRFDSWTGPLHLDQWIWDWGLGLFASDSLRLVDWSAGADYRNIRSVYDRGGTSVDNIGFQLSAGLLKGTFVPITLNADRHWSQFDSDLSGNSVGSTVTTDYGARALVLRPGYPTLQLGVAHTELENHNLAQGTTFRDTDRLFLSSQHSTGPARLGLDYTGSWGSGTFAEANAQNHYLSLLYTHSLTDRTTFRMNDLYQLRLPEREASTNPRLEYNTLILGLLHQPDQRLTENFNYRDQRASAQAPGPAAFDRQQIEHGLDASLSYRMSERLALRGAAGVSYGSTKSEVEEQTAAGESLEAGLTWFPSRGRLAMSLGVSATGRLVEPIGEPLGVGYGGSLLLDVRAAVRSMTAFLGYTASYQDTDVTLLGWVVTQQASLGIDGTYEEGSALASLTGSYTKSSDRIQGESLRRSLLVTLRAGFRATQGEALAGITDQSALLTGTSPDTPGLGADPLPLPMGLNSESRFASARLAQQLARGRASLALLAKVIESSTPGQVTVWEESGSLTATYLIGRIQLSLQERLSREGGNGQTSTVNLVMLRLARSFGGGL